MADEAPQEEAGGGSVLKKWGTMAAMVLVAQSVLAFVIVWYFFKDNAPEPQQGPLVTEEVGPQRGGTNDERIGLPFLYAADELKGITANPAGTNAQRFVMFTIKLGLVAIDHSGGLFGGGTPKDITKDLGGNTKVLEMMTPYDAYAKSIIVKIVRLKTVDQLDGDRLEEVRDEIKSQLNREIFEKLFSLDDENTTEVHVQDVIFSEIIIQ